MSRHTGLVNAGIWAMAIVAVIGVLIGAGHLRTHDLETGDVVWSVESVEGDLENALPVRRGTDAVGTPDPHAAGRGAARQAEAHGVLADHGGEKLWTETLEGGSDAPLDPSRTLIPGVRATDGLVATLTGTPKLWSTLAVGHDSPLKTSTFIDPQTGDVVARLAAELQYSVDGIGDGRALVVADENLFLVEP